MSTRQREPKDSESRKQLARTMKRRLAWLIGFLTAILLVLMFRVGEGWWPVWRLRVMTPILLADLSQVLASTSWHAFGKRLPSTASS